MPEPPVILRTICACKTCSIGCQVMPGFLAAGDLQRIYAYVQPETPDYEQWLQTHFQASDGAKAARLKGFDAQQQPILETFQIPTIVPRLTDKGCVFWDTDGKCKIHAVSPWGCSRVDSHMMQREADTASAAGLRSLLGDDREAEAYREVWQRLHQGGFNAPTLEERRRNYSALDTTPST